MRFHCCKTNDFNFNLIVVSVGSNLIDCEVSSLCIKTLYCAITFNCPDFIESSNIKVGVISASS